MVHACKRHAKLARTCAKCTKSKSCTKCAQVNGRASANCAACILKPRGVKQRAKPFSDTVVRNLLTLYSERSIVRNSRLCHAHAVMTTNCRACTLAQNLTLSKRTYCSRHKTNVHACLACNRKVVAPPPPSRLKIAAKTVLQDDLY